MGPSMTCGVVAKPRDSRKPIHWRRIVCLDCKISPRMCRLGTMDWVGNLIWISLGSLSWLEAKGLQIKVGKHAALRESIIYAARYHNSMISKCRARGSTTPFPLCRAFCSPTTMQTSRYRTWSIRADGYD
jgi:hypothetical protein